ncbi:MAG: hypothetical protein IPL61_20000 [Myxococcales bacterium]|nr:hypothetical protein [Myxococcales bacterium]
MTAARIIAALVAAAATVALAPAARAQAPATTRVAVIVDLVANVTPDRATELGGAVADALERALVVDATGGADVARRLPAEGVPDDCVAEAACIASLAHRLDATELLFLAIVQVGTTVQIDATWASAATGETRSRPRIDLEADARAGEVFAAAAERLLPHVEHRSAVVIAPPPRPTEPRRRMTTATWALGGGAVAALAGSVGLGLSARATYQRCDSDPDRCDADDRAGLRTRAVVADVLGAGALVAGGAALVLYLRSARADGPRPVQAWITPVRAGAMADVRVEF